MNTISQKDYNTINLKAMSRTYLKEIVKNTPGKGNVAGDWNIKLSGNDIIIYNEQYGDIVKYLEEGTNSHVIRAKNKKFLRFEADGTKKSKGKKIPGNVAFEKDGFVFAKAVYHPGITARLFIHKILASNRIAKEYDKEFESLLKAKLKI